MYLYIHTCTHKFRHGSVNFIQAVFVYFSFIQSKLWGQCRKIYRSLFLALLSQISISKTKGGEDHYVEPILIIRYENSYILSLSVTTRKHSGVKDKSTNFHWQFHSDSVNK